MPISSLVPMGGLPAFGAPINDKIIDDHLAVQAIIRSYQVCCVVFFFLSFVIAVALHDAKNFD